MWRVGYLSGNSYYLYVSGNWFDSWSRIRLSWLKSFRELSIKFRDTTLKQNASPLCSLPYMFALCYSRHKTYTVHTTSLNKLK
jgi:hypothetical protein